MDTRRHGWPYSLFAGAVALAMQLAWFAATATELPDLRLAATVTAITATAIAAARAGSWLAARLGRSDHGLLAATFCWPLFCLALSVEVGLFSLAVATPASEFWTGTPREIVASAVALVVYPFIIASIAVLPACLLGTLVFNLGLMALRRRADAAAGAAAP